MTQTAVTESAGLPAIREPTRLDDLARLGSWLALSESGSDSEKAKGAAAALRLYYAAELGLPPLAAAELSVIKGRLFVSAQLLRALAARAGYRVERPGPVDDKSSQAELWKDNTLVGTAIYTIEDAKKAGLIRSGSAWTTHPARMLWARASKNVIVDFAPAVALGLALDDEAPEYLGQVVAEEDIPWPEGEPAAQYDFVPPPDVQAKNEQRLEAELSKHADPVEPADG